MQDPGPYNWCRFAPWYAPATWLSRLVERDPLVPARDVRVEAERAHLRLQRDLGFGVTVDQEHLPRKPGIARALPVGETIEGPAIIEEAEATTLLLPRSTASVSPRGHLVITLEG